MLTGLRAELDQACACLLPFWLQAIAWLDLSVFLPPTLPLMDATFAAEFDTAAHDVGGLQCSCNGDTCRSLSIMCPLRSDDRLLLRQSTWDPVFRSSSGTE